MVNRMKDILWVEKYRPQLLKDIIGQDIEKIQSLIKEPMKMPNFLLVSKSPGTGKTTTALAIKREINLPDSDFMVTNSSDERKMDYIRTTLKSFAMTRRTNPDIPRIIMMDEFDGMLVPAQEMLRGFIEKYKTNVRFILTANNEEDIINPIKSRCVIIRFREPSREDIKNLLVDICMKEKVNFETDAIEKLIDTYYPDIRSMINCLQENASTGITIKAIKTRTDLEDQYYDLLKVRNPFGARELVIKNNMDVALLLKTTIKKTAEDYKDIKQLREIVYFAAEINYRMAVGSDKEIQMFAFSLKWLEIFS